jgi:hypothetical protein
VRRILLLGVVTCGVYVAGLAAGLQAPAAANRHVSAKVVVPGTEDVLALQAVAESAQTEADAHNPHNVVFTADRSVYTGVGTYADCTGRSLLTHSAAAVDTCITGVRYFIGHNPGVFTGLMNAGVGTLIGYYDATGRLHHYEVIAARTWQRADGVPAPVRDGVVAQFQTCVTADGSVDRILDAVEV